MMNAKISSQILAVAKAEKLQKRTPSTNNPPKTFTLCPSSPQNTITQLLEGLQSWFKEHSHSKEDKEANYGQL